MHQSRRPEDLRCSRASEYSLSVYGLCCYLQTKKKKELKWSKEICSKVRISHFPCMQLFVCSCADHRRLAADHRLTFRRTGIIPRFFPRYCLHLVKELVFFRWGKPFFFFPSFLSEVSRNSPASRAAALKLLRDIASACLSFTVNAQT